MSPKTAQLDADLDVQHPAYRLQAFGYLYRQLDRDPRALQSEPTPVRRHVQEEGVLALVVSIIFPLGSSGVRMVSSDFSVRAFSTGEGMDEMVREDGHYLLRVP